MKRNSKVEVINHYDKNINGLIGTVKNIWHDKDCTYAQLPYAEVIFPNGQSKVLTISFLREL